MKKILCLLILSVALGGTAVAEEPADGSSPEQRVRELYDMVSVEPGGRLPDWSAIRSRFVDEAVIFMRTSRDASSVFSLDEWVADFEAFIDKAKVGERGFTEKIVRLHVTQLRDVAEVMVLYEAGFPSSTRPPQQGVDMIHLGKIDGEWRIVSIVNDIPESPDQIPGPLMK
jgi:hypothetical protein